MACAYSAGLVALLASGSFAGVPRRPLPFFPAPEGLLLPGDPCNGDILAEGAWLGWERHAAGQDPSEVRDRITSFSGATSGAQGFMRVATDHLVAVVRRIVRRAAVLAAPMDASVQAALRLLEGMRQYLRLHKYGSCIFDDERLDTFQRLCGYLQEDIRDFLAAQHRIFGGASEAPQEAPVLCEQFAARPEVLTELADALWMSIDSVAAGPGVPHAWASWPRFPEEYARGLCNGPADAVLFEARDLRYTDPLGMPSPHLSVEQVLMRMEASGVELSYQFVNVGAAAGECGEGTVVHDPANCLALGGRWGGLMVEGDPASASQLRRAFSNRGASRSELHVLQAQLTLATASTVIQDALRHHGIPQDLDLLKIDIDLGDDLLLERLLELPLRPKLVHVEVQLMFPPDVVFQPRGGEDYAYDDSVQHLVPSLAAYLVGSGYALLHLEPPNAVLLRPDLVHLFPSAGRDVWAMWREHYLCRADLPAVQLAPRKFGDFDFMAFLRGPAQSDRGVVDAYLRLSTSSGDAANNNFNFSWHYTD